MRDDGAGERFDFLVVAGLLRDRLGISLEKVLVLGKAQDTSALTTLDEDLDRPIGKLEQLEHRSDRSHRIDVGGGGIVLGGVFLGNQEDLLVLLHDVFERTHRFFPADEERHDHVRKNDDVAQGQDGIQRAA